MKKVLAVVVIMSILLLATVCEAAVGDRVEGLGAANQPAPLGYRAAKISAMAQIGGKAGWVEVARWVDEDGYHIVLEQKF